VFNKLFIGALIVTFIVGIGLTEVQQLTSVNVSVILLACASGALLFSMAKRRSMAMAIDGEQSLEVQGFGLKGVARGQTIAIFLLAIAVLFLGYQHHVSSDEKLTRLFEAIAENTYVLSLNQAEREALRIVMPESLKRKIRGP
jgi:hypothetical protein